MDEPDLQTRFLESLKTCIRQSANIDLVRQADINIVASHFAEKMTWQMETHLLTDHILTDEKDMAFQSHITVLEDKLERRWRWLPGIYRKVERSRRVPVHGSVKVKAEYFATFPHIDSSMYPRGFGKPGRLMQSTVVANWVDQG